MWVPNTKTRRFSLYHVDQNEHYVRDFTALCTYLHPITRQIKTQDKGKIYICSKSLVFESDQQSIPLLKFRYEFMKNQPAIIEQKGLNKKIITYIQFSITRLITIKCGILIPPQPFKNIEQYNQKINIYPSFDTPQKINQWIQMLFKNTKGKNIYNIEEKIKQFIIQTQNKKVFDMSLIDSVIEKPLHEEATIFVRRIFPMNEIYGYLFITDVKIYFEPFHSISGKNVSKIEIKKIAKLFKRRYELREIGMEILTDTGKSYYFIFDNIGSRNRIYFALCKRVSSDCILAESLDKLTVQWQNGLLSNFDYLMILNQAGNRSLSDLTQYPVFPWVLVDYLSQQIDLNDPKVFRDLSKPIGALNQDRLKGFLQRYKQMPNPKFMYGTHYSAPGYVIGYLVRMKPEYMLKFQGGKFDKADRLFKSIEDDWRNVYQNPTSLKELIPQFYMSNTNFLVNYMNLDLGVRQNQEKVNHVILPKWAKNDPKNFLEILKTALQSDYVSNNLHHWIDLIFGYKQRGPQAIKANNLFNHLTYEGMIDVETIKDPMQKLSVRCQINEFGQCPKQIFKNPHPSKNNLKQKLINQAENSDVSSSDSQKEQIELTFTTSTIKNMELQSLYTSTGKAKIKTILANNKSNEIKTSQISKAHKNIITRIHPMVGKVYNIITLGQDGFLKIFDVYLPAQKACIKSYKICEFYLSSIATLKQDEFFAIGSWDNNIYLFNLAYGSKSKPFLAHDNSISDLIYLNKRKRLVSCSWDCTIKFWRVVGSNLESEDLFQDHDNQITCVTSNEEESMITYGDIEGNIICVNIEERQKVFTMTFKSQKITSLNYLKNNLVASGERQIRVFDRYGTSLMTFIMEKNNGKISDLALDGQHFFVITAKKHIGVYDMLQQKKIGSYFNDFQTNEVDRIPLQKQLTSIALGIDSSFVAIGSSTGNIYILKT